MGTLVCMNGSEESSAALQWALQQACERPLTLLHVLKPLSHVLTAEGSVPMKLVDEKWLRQTMRAVEEQAYEFMETLMQACACKGVWAEKVVAWGSRRETVLEKVKCLQPRNLVMGTGGGRRKFSKGFSEALTTYVSRHVPAGCHVHLITKDGTSTTGNEKPRSTSTKRPSWGSFFRSLSDSASSSSASSTVSDSCSSDNSVFGEVSPRSVLDTSFEANDPRRSRRHSLTLGAEEDSFRTLTQELTSLRRRASAVEEESETALVRLRQEKAGLLEQLAMLDKREARRRSSLTLANSSGQPTRRKARSSMTLVELGGRTLMCDNKLQNAILEWGQDYARRYTVQVAPL